MTSARLVRIQWPTFDDTVYRALVLATTRHQHELVEQFRFPRLGEYLPQLIGAAGITQQHGAGDVAEFAQARDEAQEILARRVVEERADTTLLLVALAWLGMIAFVILATIVFARLMKPESRFGI